MRVIHAAFLLGALISITSLIGACKDGGPECFASKGDCVHPRTVKEDIDCFSQLQVYCFIVKGDMFDKPEGQSVCMPTEDECWEWRHDRTVQRPSLWVGYCEPRTAK